MLKRFLKKLGYSWKRFRKSLKSLQDEAAYEAKLLELKQLYQLYHTGYIDLRFADETGFNLQGYIPYGWQPKGTYIHITPQKTPSTQVFGIMGLDHQLAAYSCTGSMNSVTIIAFLDDFCRQLKQPTVVVMDNAPIHHSAIFDAKIKQWQSEDLYIFFLPKYSPHLNPIEILWKKIKYEWLKYENILTQKELVEKLEEVLTKFGSEYQINFKKKSVDYF